MTGPIATHPIVEVEAALCENGRSVLLYGHTDNPAVTFVQSVTLPIAISAAEFIADEWTRAARADRWRLA